MSKPQSFLKKLMKVIGVIVFLSMLFVGGCGYYVFFYPVNVTEKADQSIEVGQSIVDIFKFSSVFMQQMGKSHFPYISFGANSVQDDNSEDAKCASITVAFRAPEKNRSLRKVEAAALSEFIEKHKDQYAECGQFRVTFMPAFVYRCTVVIHFDNAFKVTQKEKFYCWD